MSINRPRRFPDEAPPPPPPPMAKTYLLHARMNELKRVQYKLHGPFVTVHMNVVPRSTMNTNCETGN